MAGAAAAMISGGGGLMMSGFRSQYPRPDADVITNSVLERARRTARGITAAVRMSKPVVKGPLGDITNVTSHASGKAQGVPPRPPKRRSVSEDCSPAKLRALHDGRAAPVVEDEYVPHIMERLLAEEKSALPSANFLNLQKDINRRMRAILVDWLVEVHAGYKLRRATLFLAVNLVDRYLSKAIVPRVRLQLVGVVALLVAAKFEEVKPPSVKRLAHMTAGAFSTEDLLTFECVFLAKLGFKVLVPTAGHFLDHMCRSLSIRRERMERAFFALELSLLDDKFSQYEPSAMAAAALIVSGDGPGHYETIPAITKRMQMQPSSEEIAAITKRTSVSLEAPAADLRVQLKDTPKAGLGAIRKKYSPKD